MPGMVCAQLGEASFELQQLLARGHVVDLTLDEHDGARLGGHGLLQLVVPACRV